MVLLRVERIELFKVPPRWLFLKLTTDTGLVGWGEPIVEGKAETVKAAVLEMGEFVLNQDPLRIEDHWQTLYRAGFYRGGPVLMSAISGIDQALWDIKGKHYGAPIHELLGGRVRDRVAVYSWIGGDRSKNVGEEALEKKQLGFSAVKMNGTEELHYVDSYTKVDEVVQRVESIRNTAGRDLGIGIDFHGRVHKPMAKVLFKALSPYNIMFIEEPVLSENWEALRDLTSFGIPIALGERLFSRWDYKSVLASGYVDIIQPDLSHAGGITETRKIAAMAEAYDVAVAPHCPLGPISLASALQLDACTPNVFIQEQSLGIHYNTSNDLLDYLVDPGVFAYEEGFVGIPEAPGLGIEIDEVKVREMSEVGHNWRNPVWRNTDGTIAEW